MNEEEEKQQEKAAEEEIPQEVSEVDLLLAQLEEAQREQGQFRSLAQRVQADFVNYKRRVEEEREEQQRWANANLVGRLLSVLDDFERALQHVPNMDAGSPWIQGIELAYRNFRGVLEIFGVTQIEAQGKSFDPLEHEAIFYEVSQDHEDGKVMSVVRQGYKLHGRVLRPAQVTVSKREERQDKESNDDKMEESSGKESE